VTLLQSDPLLAFAKRYYDLPDSARFVPGSSGMNNTTRIIEAGDRRYILRIYETHRDENKVRFEHDVLQRLQQLSEHHAKLRFPYQIPRPVKCRDGGTIARTDEGKLAALVHYIEGERPKLQFEDQIVSFGRAVAALSRSLAQLDLSSDSAAYPPYYELEHTHPSCTPEVLASFCTNPPPAFEQYHSMLHKLGDWCEAFWKEAPRLRTLPQQLIHGDLNATNMLADVNGRISALLDFEFVTTDLRLMEAAVCMSDLIVLDDEGSVDEARSRARMSQFLQGWCELSRMSEEESELLPLLIQLRRVDVFVHFLGRYFDGVDDIAIVQHQIVQACRIVDWLQEQ